jgi:tRNA-2-methylthio-N6-dimethylallyladenosine synthase
MTIENNQETKPKKGLFVQSYGCQMNVYDSERMVDVLAPLGYAPVDAPEKADLVVLNTCHIREKATEKVYSEIGRLKQQKDAKQKDGNGMMIAVAGCVAQAEGAEIMRRAPVVDLVVGPQAYHHLPELIAKAARKSGAVLDTSFEAIEKFDALPLKRENTGISAFLSVQEGCDKFCSFCVVPYTRGAEYSRPFANVIEEAKSLADSGVVEINLLGQNVNAYNGGDDIKKYGLGALIRQIAKIDGIERIRYTTSHPCDMEDDLIAAHGEVPELMPYLHLPVQSGSNKILKAMNRKHTAESYLETLAKFRAARPDIALASDFIVGFPGETDEDFEATMNLVREVNYSSAYSFKYSRRPGTPASAMMRQIAEDVKDARLQELQALLAHQQSAFNINMIGQNTKILVTNLGKREGQVFGKSPYLQSMFLSGGQEMVGKILEVKITGSGPQSLSAELVGALK